MTIWAYRPESRWKRQRRLRRMVDKACMPRTGVVLRDKTWQVIALTVAVISMDVFAVVRWWMGGC